MWPMANGQWPIANGPKMGGTQRNGCVFDGPSTWQDKWLHQPCRGRTSARICYVIPTFSLVPERDDTIQTGCIPLAFSGAPKMQGIAP